MFPMVHKAHVILLNSGANLPSWPVGVSFGAAAYSQLDERLDSTLMSVWLEIQYLVWFCLTPLSHVQPFVVFMHTGFCATVLFLHAGILNPPY